MSSKEVVVVGGLVQGLAALCDILITGGLCYYLQTGRSGLKTFVSAYHNDLPTANFVGLQHGYTGGSPYNLLHQSRCSYDVSIFRT